MKSKKQIIELQPKQKIVYDLIESSSTAVIGYGGSKGGGKSALLRMAMVLRRQKYPGTRGLLFRRTFPELNKNHILRVWEQFPQLRKHYNKQERVISFPNGSTLTFGYAEFDSDIEQYQGDAYDDIFIDQSEQHSEYVLAFLKANNRPTGRELSQAKFVLSFNPGGPSHGWHKRKFVMGELSDAEKNEGWEFVQAHAWDNVEWVREELGKLNVTPSYFYKQSDEWRRELFLSKASYGKTLLALPDEGMRRAYLWGDWDIFSGQFFDIRKEIHTAPPTDINPSWEVRGAIDFGRTTTFYTGTRDQHDRIIIDNEVQTEAMVLSERATAIGRKLIEKKIYQLMIYGDTDMFSDDRYYKGSDKSPAKVFRDTWDAMFTQAGIPEHAPYLVPVAKKKEDNKRYRLQCNEAFKEYLNFKLDDQNRLVEPPRLIVTEECYRWWKNVPSLMFDEKNPVDIDPKIGIDHEYDASKYVVMALYKPPDIEEKFDLKSATREQREKYFREYLQKHLDNPVVPEEESKINFTYW